jgi:hypothetical protein
MDLKLIKQLISIIENADITHFSIEEEGVKYVIKKQREIQNLSHGANIPVPSIEKTIEKPVEIKTETNVNYTTITSQMVGTFYASPNPDSKPYVQVGDTLKKGQIVCIIEAMKLFNEVESEIEGIVEKICVKNGDPIEFGQALFHVRSA